MVGYVFGGLVGVSGDYGSVHWRILFIGVRGLVAIMGVCIG